MNLLRWAQRCGRAMLLMLFVGAGTIVLIRFAPGYFSDAREIDARYAHTAQAELQNQQAQAATLRTIAATLLRGWAHGDLGRSRQYDLPVAELLRARIGVTAVILAKGIAYGWILALGAALVVSLARGWATLLHVPFTVLLALPIGAIGTVCMLAGSGAMLSGSGGPVFVLTLLLAARDFKFLARLLRSALRAPCLLHAEAQGMRRHRILRVHLLPGILPQLLALAVLSLVTALSALVPVEVIFDVPGLGQLAWNAAMNRDLPVLVAVTLLMAAIVAATGIVSDRRPELETA